MLVMTKTDRMMGRQASKSFLSAMEVFKNVPAAGLQEIESAKIEKKYNKCASIFLEDDAAAFVWFVKEGHVKEVIHSVEGKNLTLSMVGAGGIFGTSVFAGGEYGCHGVAETDATVLAIPFKTFQALMGKYPEIGRAVVTQISKLLRHSKDTQTYAQESVEKRILHVLADLVHEFGNTIPLTRKEIAEMAGTTVETAIRTFSKLEAAGLVSSVRGKIILRNVKDVAERLNGI